MERFDENGMMIFPNPDEEHSRPKQFLVLQEGYCPNGHNLVNPRIVFNRFPGVLVKVKTGDGREGMVGMSAIFGDRSRMSLDVDLKEGEILQAFCPECNAPLPVYAPCSCGANLLALYTTTERSFSDAVGICSRVDCYNAQIKTGGQMMELSTIEKLGWD